VDTVSLDFSRLEIVLSLRTPTEDFATIWAPRMSMKEKPKTTIWILMVLFVAAISFARLSRGQEPRSPDMHITTQERLETESWWPTMATAPLHAYAGSANCAPCHRQQLSATPTGMQSAASRTVTTPWKVEPTTARFRSGSLSYGLTLENSYVELSVSDGTHKVTQKADWLVGAGILARTYLYQADGRWFQSEASYYTQPSLLDITTGFGASTSLLPAAAMGNLLGPAEARACFGCHTVHATTCRSRHRMRSLPWSRPATHGNNVRQKNSGSQRGQGEPRGHLSAGEPVSGGLH